MDQASADMTSVVDVAESLAGSHETTPFGSFRRLHNVHGRLLRLFGRRSGTPIQTVTVRKLVQQLKVTGKILYSLEERQAAQTFLDYWLAQDRSASRAVLLDEFDKGIAYALVKEPCPYRGLAPFGSDNVGDYYGRCEDVLKACEQLDKHPFLAVVGPSGMGKSSFVMAGLVPVLRQSGWQEARIVPGAEPLKSLEAVVPTIPGEQSGTPIREQGRTLIVIDQFEELFTLCGDPSARSGFTNKLATLVADPSHFRVIVTIRNDFLRFADGELSVLLRDYQLNLQPLSTDQLQAAIEIPARTAGVEFERGVVTSLIREVQWDPSGLPLLQFALTQLWRDLPDTGNTISYANYIRRGGARGAMTFSAEAMITDNSLSEHQIGIMMRILLRVIRPNEGAENTNSRVPYEVIYDAQQIDGATRLEIDDLVGMLKAAGLVRVTSDESGENKQVELAHESLTWNWDRLREGIRKYQETISKRQRMEGYVLEWIHQGKQGGYLDKNKLTEATEFVKETKSNEIGFDPRLCDLIDASGMNERRVELGKLAQVLIVVGLPIVCFILWLLYINRMEKIQNLAFFQATRAVNVADDKAPIAIVLAHEALRLKGGSPITRQAAEYVAGRNVMIDRFIPGDGSIVLRTQYSPDGKWLLVGYRDGSICVFDKQMKPTWLVENDKDHPKSEIRAIAFSSNTKHSDVVAVGSKDGDLRIYNLADGSSKTYQIQASNDLWCAAISQDCSTLATGRIDGTIDLFKLPSTHFWPKELVRIGKPRRTGNSIMSLAFRPNQELISTSVNGDIDTWDLGLNQIGLPVRAGRVQVDLAIDGHNRGYPLETAAQANNLDVPVRCMAYDPQHNRIAVGRDDGVILLCEKRGNQSVFRVVRGHVGIVYGVSFSGDGGRLASASADGTVRIWDVSDACALLAPLTGHAGEVNTVTFEPDSDTVVSGGDDEYAIRWNLKAVVSEAAHRSSITCMTYSNDGRYLVSAGANKSLYVWNSKNGSYAGQGISDTGLGKAFSMAVFDSGNDQDLACGYRDYVQIYSLPSLKRGRYFQSSKYRLIGAVRSMSIDPTRTYLAAAGLTDQSGNNAIVVWNIRNWSAVVIPVASGPAEIIGKISFVPVAGGVVPQGSLAVAMSDGWVRFWNISTRQEIGRSAVDVGGEVLSLAFNPKNPNEMATCRVSDDRLAIWDLREHASPSKQCTLLPGIDSTFITDIAYAPDGQHIVTASRDHLVTYWNTEGSAQWDLPLYGHSGEVNCVAVNPSDGSFASGGSDGLVLIWSIPRKDQVSRIGELYNETRNDTRQIVNSYESELTQ